jgi:2-iminoacetate synthase ThiH
MNNWIEGEDFYYNEQGFIVLTAKYHLYRGHCCGNGCKHCPFEKPPQTPPEEGLKSSK